MAADPIDDYVRALDHRLTGPRAARRDLLTEARDSLIDAAEAYGAAGLDRRQAELRAVTEFGALDRIAPQYQRELAAGTARRLALLVAAVPALAMAFDDLMWRGSSWATAKPSPGYLLVAVTLDYLHYALAALAVLAFVGLRRLARTGGDPRRWCQALSFGTLGALGLTVVLGATVYVWTIVLYPQALTWPPMVIGGALTAAAGAWQLMAAVRCLRAARPLPHVRQAHVTPALAGRRRENG